MVLVVEIKKLNANFVILHSTDLTLEWGNTCWKLRTIQEVGQWGYIEEVKNKICLLTPVSSTMDTNNGSVHPKRRKTIDIEFNMQSRKQLAYEIGRII